MSIRTEVSGGVPSGTRSGRSAAVPTDSRGMTTSPSSSASASTAIPSRPSRTSNGLVSRPSSTVRQRSPSRTWTRERRSTSGRWASSSNVSSASIRPPIADVARRATGQRDGLGDAHLGRGPDEPADAIARAERAQQRGPEHERKQAGGDGEEGDHGGDDTRRAWKGPKEPTRHVGVDAIAAVSVARPLRAGPNGTVRRDTVARGLIHEFRDGHGGYPHRGHRRRPSDRRIEPQFEDRPVAGSSALSCPS